MQWRLLPLVIAQLCKGAIPGSLTSQAIPFRWADQGVASNATTECPTLLPGAWADPLAGYLLRSARNQRGAFFVELMVIGTAPSSSAYSSIERVTQSGISAPQCFIHQLSRYVKRPADERHGAACLRRVRVECIERGFDARRASPFPVTDECGSAGVTQSYPSAGRPNRTFHRLPRELTPWWWSKFPRGNAAGSHGFRG